jgi:hypothetical protein
MRHVGRLVLGLVIITIANVLTVGAGSDFGHFEGTVIASFLPDGRNMKLEAPFTYVDAEGMRWEVPKGVTTDGASIPRVFCSRLVCLLNRSDDQNAERQGRSV